MGTPDNLPQTPVHADEIRWQIGPAPRYEDVDVLGLTEMELLAYTQTLQRDARQVRELLHEAIGRLAKNLDVDKRKNRTIEDLRQQIREQRPA